MTDILIEWEPPVVDNDQLPVESIRLSRSASPDLDAVEIATVPWTDLSFTLSNEPPGTHYFEGVFIDTDGNESEATQASVTIGHRAPNAPVITVTLR